jgi:hypothetical protein
MKFYLLGVNADGLMMPSILCRRADEVQVMVPFGGCVPTLVGDGVEPVVFESWDAAKAFADAERKAGANWTYAVWLAA